MTVLSSQKTAHALRHFNICGSLWAIYGPNATAAGAIFSGLALIGGLAAACFTRCFGFIFLGEPRNEMRSPTLEVSALMRWPMVILAAACLAIGLTSPWSIRLTVPAIQCLISSDVPVEPLMLSARMLAGVAVVSAGLLVLAVIFYVIRRNLTRGKEERTEVTWDCGYARPTARMQYTASSFAQPLLDLFRVFLGTRHHGVSVQGFFPKHANHETETPDGAKEWLFAPLFRGIDRLVAPMRILQHGRIHLYVLYIALTLLTLLIWKAGFLR